MVQDKVNHIIGTTLNFSIINFVIILLSLIAGIGAIGLLLCVSLWAYSVQANVPKYIKQHKLNDDMFGHPRKQIDKFSFLYCVAIIIPYLICVYGIFYLFEDQTWLATHIYESNYWFSSVLYDLIPTIQNHSEAAKARGDTIWRYYITFYSLSYWLVIIAPLCAVVNYNIFKDLPAIPHRKKGLYKKRYWYLLGILFYLCLFYLGYFVLGTDQPVIQEGRHPIRHYNAFEDDRHFYLYMSVGLFVSFLTNIFFAFLFKTLNLIIKGEK